MTTPIRPRICLWFALTVLRVFGVFGGVLHAEVTAATEGVQGVQGVPRFNSARYEDLWTRSPFGIETAPIMVIKQGPSFAENLAISGIVRGDGKESVTLVNAKTRKFFRATKGGGADYELVSLTIDRDRRNSRAVIRHGGETAEVRFPEANMKPISKPLPKGNVTNSKKAAEESRPEVTPPPRPDPRAPARRRRVILPRQ